MSPLNINHINKTISTFLNTKLFVENVIKTGEKRILKIAPAHENEAEVIVTMTFSEGVERNCQSHHWYGGDIVDILVTCKNKAISGTLFANGEINAEYWKDNDCVCAIKDRRRLGGFNKLKPYINCDDRLINLIEDETNEENYLELFDSNWWELFYDDEEDGCEACWVLDGYLLTDVLHEAVFTLLAVLLK